MVNLIYLQQNGLRDVMSDKRKVGMMQPMLYVCFPPGEEVIEDDDFVTVGHESIDEVGAYEAGSSCDEYLFAEGVWEAFGEDDVGSVEGGDGLGGKELLVGDEAVDVLAFAL